MPASASVTFVGSNQHTPGSIETQFAVKVNGCDGGVSSGHFSYELVFEDAGGVHRDIVKRFWQNEADESFDIFFEELLGENTVVLGAESINVIDVVCDAKISGAPSD
jgi:hypothetical protein